MSDRDADHVLSELQEARAEIDLLRAAIRKHIEAMKPYKGAYYDLELWAVLDSLPGEGGE